MKRLGIDVGRGTVARLLKQMGFSLRVNRKSISSGSSEDRDAQFEHIASLRERFAANGDPIVSIDTKKKELVGQFKNAGTTWTREPVKVNDHDFRSQAVGMAVPYGIYDVQDNSGAVVVGTSHETSEFAVVVVERLRVIGRDPRLVRETVRAARRHLRERRPALEREMRGVEREKERLEAERRNLVDAVAQDGRGVPALLQRVGEAEVALAETQKRLDALRGELAVLENAAIDEGDLRRALAAFDPVWDELFPAERARIVQLLLERVTYDGEEGEVEITFRPGGVRALAEEQRKETA